MDIASIRPILPATNPAPHLVNCLPRKRRRLEPRPRHHLLPVPVHIPRHRRPLVHLSPAATRTPLLPTHKRRQPHPPDPTQPHCGTAIAGKAPPKTRAFTQIGCPIHTQPLADEWAPRCRRLEWSEAQRQNCLLPPRRPTTPSAPSAKPAPASSSGRPSPKHPPPTPTRIAATHPQPEDRSGQAAPLQL